MTSFGILSATDSKSVTRRKVTIAIVMGLLFPIVAWVIDISLKGIAFNFANLVAIHKTNGVLWIIDIFPLVITYLTWVQLKRHYSKVAILERELNQRDEDISKNALFAKRIGEGDYVSAFEIGGEDDILGKSLVLMRNNLLANQRKEGEQNWIARGKDEISYILRLHNNIEELSYDVLVKLIKYINTVQGALYLYNEERQTLSNLATYAYNRKKYLQQEFKVGQGLIGECAYELDYIYRTEIPDDYATITSGILGDKKPKSLLLIPLITDEKLEGVLEFASVEDEIPELTIRFLREVGEIIARTIFNLRINQKTEKLLQEAQQMNALQPECLNPLFKLSAQLPFADV